MLVQGLPADGLLPGGAGLVRGLLQVQQRVDRLPGPGDVAGGPGLGDRDQLAQQVLVMAISP